MQAVAKGARKPTGKLAGKVQLFSACDFLIAKGRSLDVVAEASLVDAHAGLRGDLDRVSAASAVCEVCRLCSFEGSRDPFLARILDRALTACEEASDQPHLDVFVAAFVFKVLAREGWRPQLDGCCLCDDPAPTRFSAVTGGLLCESCSSRIEGQSPWTRARSRGCDRFWASPSTSFSPRRWRPRRPSGFWAAPTSGPPRTWTRA